MLMNLIDNAIKYGKDQDKKVEVRILKKVKYVWLEVEDNGIGIRSQYHEKVFELFHRLNPFDGPDGEGFGLTIAKRIVQNHNGKIWIESQEGQGSRFYIALPSQTLLFATHDFSTDQSP
jgi:signal transduction histidine kinase